MGLKERIHLYHKIEKLRGHPVVTYFMSDRNGASASMSSDAIPILADQLMQLGREINEVDFIIHSMGGDPLAAWRMITMIREYLGKPCKISCIIPLNAFSAATLFALGCNSIFMHRLASLGPVDPQVISSSRDGQTHFAHEDLLAYLRFLKEDSGLTEQSEKKDLIAQLIQEIKPTTIGTSKRASIEMRTIAEKLLKLHLEPKDSDKAGTIAEKLSKNYSSHGHAVSKSEAKELELVIENDDPELEELIWAVYNDFREDWKMLKPFNPLEDLLATAEGKNLLTPPSFVNFPQGLDPNVSQTFWQNILAGSISPGVSVECDLPFAAMESIRCSYQVRAILHYTAIRQPDLNILLQEQRISGFSWSKIETDYNADKDL